MSKKNKVVEILLLQKLLPLYYHESSEVSLAILQALYNAGVRIVEYTNRGANALENFKVLRKTADRSMQDLQLGIGTIKTTDVANDYIQAGADFIVCPTVNTLVAETVHHAGLLWIPGCMTPTEIAVAEVAGAEIVKIFPGNVLGPTYINSIKELFPGIQFMPTGGVEAEMQNLQSWFKAGVVAVGMGSKLITKPLIEQEAYSNLSIAATQALQLVREASTV
jgi:2-dehydro-3-deoxyphosphogluconate aldolase/(4S)-4-hydroxy-2-oxoglutarate aldolase